MESLIATRSELLDRRRRAVFVAQGRDLLKDKRTALVREFRQHRTELLDGLEQLRSLAVQARQRVDQATAICGPEALGSGALVAATGIGADLQSRAVAGVQVFELRHDPVRRNPATRGWAPALVSAQLDAVAAVYEEQLEWQLDLCAVELSVRRLATELARTTKQVNALDITLTDSPPSERRPGDVDVAISDTGSGPYEAGWRSTASLAAQAPRTAAVCGAGAVRIGADSRLAIR
ncbi:MULTISPECIES: V-type ATP synthase subunit D [unclassified Kribbella]|uniref:V-type ATP synthase subunit D n=1 Tax=unclassified Kribbella TaxID=2644121 RepID=UPI0033F4EC82